MMLFSTASRSHSSICKFRLPLLWHAVLLTAAFTAFAGMADSAETAPEKPRFFSMVLFVMVDESQPRDHWANADLNFSGLKNGCEMLDASISKALGKPSVFPVVIVLIDLPKKPEVIEFLKKRVAAGNQIGVQEPDKRAAVANALGISPDELTVQAVNWNHGEKPERTMLEVQSGLRTKFDAVLEGDSLIGETIDLGHNWEGRPFFPYYVQMRPDQPWLSAMTNRELREKNAPLDLLWLTRTPWSDYDRLCFTYSFHLSDSQIWKQPRIRPGDIWFWKNEIRQWEANLASGNIPFAHLSIGHECCNVAPEYRTEHQAEGQSKMLGELADKLLQNGWKPVTGEQFRTWYASNWPSPEAPAQVLLFNDTSRNPEGKYFTVQGEETQDMGNILIAETKYFRVVDHQHRLSPFHEIAYELESPNLMAASYAAHDIRTEAERTEENHMARLWTDGTGQVGDPRQIRTSSTTGNALFWGDDPHRGIPSKWETLAPSLGVPADAPKNRGYTLIVDGRDVQFPEKLDLAKPYGEFFDVQRTDDSVSWKKRVRFQHNGKEVSLVIAHRLHGKEHTVDLKDETNALNGAKLELAFRPHFYQAWLKDQERMVYGTTSGMKAEAFAYKTDNADDVEKRIELDSPLVTAPFLKLYHCDPTRLEMARMVDISLPAGKTKAIRFIDQKGSWIWTEARVELDSLAGFTLRYRRLDGLGD